MRRTDSVDIYAYAKAPVVSRYMTWEPHKTMKDTYRFVHKVLQAYKQGETVRLGYCLAEDKKSDWHMWFP